MLSMRGVSRRSRGMGFRLSQVMPSVRRSVALAAALAGLCGEGLAADAAAPAAQTKKTKAVKPAVPPRPVGATLDARSAAIAANAVCRQIKGGRVIAVEPNGRMGPVFETSALLVVEPTRAENLRIGDIVTYEHPTRHETVVQRVLEVRDGQFLADGGVRLGSAETGDGLMRVVVILYVRENSGANVLAANGSPAPRAKNAADGAVAATQTR